MPWRYHIWIVSLACVSSETHNLQRIFRLILHTNGESLCQAFLAETMETGTKNLCVIEATHVLKKALERLNFERFRNVSVHEFYRLKALITLEQVNTTEWSKKKKNFKQTAMVGRCTLSLYANGVLWWACGSFSAMIEMTCHVNHFVDLWQWFNFSGIEALEFSSIYTRV